MFIVSMVVLVLFFSNNYSFRRKKTEYRIRPTANNEQGEKKNSSKRNKEREKKECALMRGEKKRRIFRRVTHSGNISRKPVKYARTFTHRMIFFARIQNYTISKKKNIE